MLMTALMLTLATVAAGEPQPTPLRWGFDDIGVRGLDCWNEGCLLKHPKAAELLEEFRFNLWVTWYPDAAYTWPMHRNQAYIESIDSFCGIHNLHWVCNQLATCWNNAPEHGVDENGWDWYSRDDGRRFHQFPDVLLDTFGRCHQLLGLMYDEPEHHQNNANFVPGLDKPAIFDPKGYTLLTAADGHVAAARAVADHHAKFGIQLYTEHVLPVMYHDFAKAGFTAATKILKETWSPVYIACAMGAAIQYGRELWITPDLWGVNGYPGHSPEEYRSSLLLAYHLGADCIYTESLSEPGGEGRSLIHMTPTDYSVTDYGDVAKWFIREYVPQNPRYYRFQNLKPRTVIIRQEDACYGQRFVGFDFLPDRLFGEKTWHSTPDTEAWIRLWNLLSGGVIPETSLTWWAYPSRPFQVLCPLDGVVVFDHTVRREHMEGAEVIVLTGIGVSPETLADVDSLVKEGATCLALYSLLPADVQEHTGRNGVWHDGKGRWVSTDDFLAAHVKEEIEHVIPKDQSLHYRFGDTTVTMAPDGGDMIRIVVSEVTTGGPLPVAVVAGLLALGTILGAVAVKRKLR